MQIDLTTAHSIAIVGNGGIRANISAEIDACDLVIRMNHAPLCGVAGRRTDILVLNRHSIRRQFRKRPANRKAMRKATEIWLGFEGFATPLENERLDKIANGRRVRMLQVSDELKMQIAGVGVDSTTVVPSLGARVLDAVVRECDADIKLFGFDHEGWSGHSWELEKRWFDALSPKRVQRLTGSGALLIPAFSYSVYREAGLVKNQFMRFAQNLGFWQ